ncbi:8-oxo-dGTP diphosphatase [Planctomycetes bacterium Pan216]|uniref:8-oxo-dGTP diphosphatase n=1 Tax=Kolteria novifilia TaxID=2527975 RepID=A0A518B4J5_9BACT|nr:8-oxo-dGTP diphosphatase [Planctomycetes bacterium Pan216]
MDITRVAIGIVWRGGRVLVGRRSQDVPLGGAAEFPGGKCKPNEPPAATVVRECREETGLRVRVAGKRHRCKHQYDHGRLELHFFDCVIADPDGDAEPRPPFDWVDLQTVADLDFPEANAMVLSMIVGSPLDA